MEISLKALAAFIYLSYLLAYLGISIALGYAAFHFISKYW